MISATRLFVGNLPEKTEERDLHDAFSSFGEITTLDLKCKPGSGIEAKKFAFVSISAANNEVESCIKHFSNEDFNGNRLYVTRARESFLERLQRERNEAQQKAAEKTKPQENLAKKNPVLKLSDRLNPRKRKISEETNNVTQKTKKPIRKEVANIINHGSCNPAGDSKKITTVTEADKKKFEAERKRMESMKKKRQEFKDKQLIIKSSLTGVDKIQNKKLVFTDGDDSPMEVVADVKKTKKHNNRTVLFDDEAEDSDNELNFEIKKQFEGKTGQKVLDLQSRYKSDKRFTLDERFIDEEEAGKEGETENEEVELGYADEKAQQLNILQDVLGVTLKTKVTDPDSKKNKPKLGMLRFDPRQPDHAKFLAPVEAKPERTKKSKNKGKEKTEEIQETPQPEPNVPKVEVSKEQFYKVSETLKEAIAQPNTFTLRSLFGNNADVDNGPQEQDTDYIPLDTTKEKKKVKNPLDLKEKNPFVYDSSDSETEEPVKEAKVEVPPPTETKAVWKENLFFTKSDPRLIDGLAFFNKAPENEVQKERRELKSLVKKRMYNNDRKNQMFKRKIGGRKKSMKKPYKNKS